MSEQDLMRGPVKGPDFAATHLAYERRFAENWQAQAALEPTSEAITRTTEANTRVVGAHRAAAADGYLGAYPLPAVVAGDDWHASGPGLAADVHAAADYSAAASESDWHDYWGPKVTQSSDDDADGWF